jgi:hypothetical protein
MQGGEVARLVEQRNHDRKAGLRAGRCLACHRLPLGLLPPLLWSAATDL